MLCVLYASGVAVVIHSFIAVSDQALAPRGRKLEHFLPAFSPEQISLVFCQSDQVILSEHSLAHLSSSERVLVFTGNFVPCLLICLIHVICFRLIYVEVFLLASDRIRDQQGVYLEAIDRLYTFLVVSFTSLFHVELYQFIDCVVIL